MSGYFSPWMYGASGAANAVPTNGFLFAPGESPYTIPPEALKALASGNDFAIPAGLSPDAPDISPALTAAQMPNFNTGLGGASGMNFSTGMPTSVDLNKMTMGNNAFAPAGVNTAYSSGFDGGTTAPQTFMQKAGAWASNGDNVRGAAQALGALTSAWLGFQQLKVAKDQLGFQKQSWQKNFANQTKSYNTSLEDRIRGRSAGYDGKENDVQAYLNKHKMSG